MAFYETFKSKIIPALQKELGVKNIMAVPRLKMVKINAGIGTITSEAAEYARMNGLIMIRVDNRAAMAGTLFSIIQSHDLVSRVMGKGEMEFHMITDPAKDLEMGSYGILEPLLGLEHAKPEDFDLLIAPGAVFDTNGFRIGYGGGFYDRYIKRLRHECPVIGLGFELQMVDRVPAEPFDKAVDIIVTENRVIRAG